MFRAFANLDFLRAAVFLCINFLDAALSMALTVELKTESVFMPEAIADLHFLIDVLSADLRTTFLNALLLLTSTRLIADFILGKLFTPFAENGLYKPEKIRVVYCRTPAVTERNRKPPAAAGSQNRLTVDILAHSGT